MKISAIICEYNPLHKGHLHHIEQTRRLTNADIIVCIMSGNYTQRGDVACLDKYTRAKHAILGGCDCVIELPPLYATSGADYFAYGAVSLAKQIKGITHISFGSECGDLERLHGMSNAITSPLFNDTLSASLSQGLSYPVAAQRAYESIGIKHGICPNDTLAIAYMRAISGSGITPITIARCGSGYHDNELGAGYASATAIRRAIASCSDVSAHVPSYVLDDISHITSTNTDRLFAIIASNLLSGAADVYEDGEGLVNRARDMLSCSSSYSELQSNTHSKRYTLSRINRFLLHVALHHTPSLLQAPLDYMRVLAIRNDCRDNILSRLLPGQSESPLLANDNYCDAIYSVLTNYQRGDRRLQIIE